VVTVGIHGELNSLNGGSIMIQLLFLLIITLLLAGTVYAWVTKMEMRNQIMGKLILAAYLVWATFLMYSNCNY